MAGFRDRFIKLAGGITQVIPFKGLRWLSGQRVILPVYHLISDKEVPHIKNLYTVKGTRKFVEDLDFLLKHFEPIDYFEFKKLKFSGLQPNKPSFLLSFDDGLRECHDVIAPILKEKGVPAIFFLNSDFIDNKALFFRYKVSLLIEEINKRVDKAAYKPWFSEYGEGYGDIKSFLLSVKYDQEEILDELAGALNYSFEDYLKAKQPYLTSDQINNLKAQGFQFGAHSIDHPEYRFLPLVEQLRQTRESVKVVASQFDLSYRIFAFPFTDYGVKKEFFKCMERDDRVEMTFGCAGQKIERDGFRNYQRIPLEVEHLSAEQIVSAELLYYILRAHSGLHYIRRD